MYNIVIPNLKLQIAYEELKLEKPVVPNFTSQIKAHYCCEAENTCCPIQPPPNPCCSSPITDELELKALEIEAYNKYAPKYNCCGFIR